MPIVSSAFLTEPFPLLRSLSISDIVMSNRQLRPQQSRQATARTNRTAGTARTTTTQNDVDYSLAGPQQSQQKHHDPHNTYYEDGYRELNPWMEQNKHHGSFSLAGTFPHNVRFGMNKKQKKDPRQVEAVQAQEKGETEPAPQVEEAEASRQDPREDDRNRASDQEKPPQPNRTDTANNEHPSLGQISEQPTAEAEEYSIPDEDDSSDLDSSSIKFRSISQYNSKGQRRGTIAEEATDTKIPLSPSDRPFNHWAVIRLYLQRPLAEWLGTTVFMFIGISGNLSVITSDYQTGTMQSMYWCWGFAVMLAIYIAGGGSGAFLNPALTIMLSIFRGFPGRRVPVYIFVQILGAFTGSLLAFAIYKDNILHLSRGLLPDSTGSAFYTEPKDWVSNSTAFFTELLGTAMIGCSILALGDSSNSPPGAGMHAFIIGLLTTAVTMSLGWSTGGCFNPVRDLGPRLATIAAGYPISSFSARQNWWIWGPWCATITGALIGALLYDLCIFKGGESPVNYSFGRWKIEGLKRDEGLASMFGMHKKEAEIERRLENGDIHDDPKMTEM